LEQSSLLKNLEVALPASIFFGAKDSHDQKERQQQQQDDKTKVTMTSTADDQDTTNDDNENDKEFGGREDPFCTGVNSYVKVEFKIVQFGHVDITSKSITLLPKGNNASFMCERVFQSGEYIIWNSWGDVNYAWSPET